MSGKRLVVWFSCGAASAVAAKLCLAKHRGEYDIEIARCVVANEHQDNDRFASDCEQTVVRLGMCPMAMLHRDGAGKTSGDWRRFQRSWARPAAIFGHRDDRHFMMREVI